MKCTLYVGESKRGSVYFGTLEIGKRKFLWTLFMPIPMDKMDAEMERRKKAGEETNTPKAHDELFNLLVFDEKHMPVFANAAFHSQLCGLIVRECASFHGAPISEMWDQLSGGQMASPFSVGIGLDVDFKGIPKQFR